METFEAILHLVYFALLQASCSSNCCSIPHCLKQDLHLVHVLNFVHIKYSYLTLILGLKSMNLSVSMQFQFQFCSFCLLYLLMQSFILNYQKMLCFNQKQRMSPKLLSRSIRLAPYWNFSKVC